MNILKDNLSGIASKRAYTAPMMEVVVMDHHMDLLQGSLKYIQLTGNEGSYTIEEE